MDDSIAMGFILMIGVLAFVFAKWTDTRWRIKFLRSRTKKDYYLGNIVSEDKRVLYPKMFLPENGVIEHKGMQWCVDTEQVFREGAVVEKKIRVSEKGKPTNGFTLSQSSVKWEEGIPVIYIDEKTFRPIGFDFEHENKTPTPARPSEASSIMKGWLSNAMMKIMASTKKFETLLIVACLVGAAAAGIGYLCKTQLDDMKVQISSLQNQTADIHNVLLPPPKIVEPTKAGG
jgi:hypothetical protein